MLTTHTLAQNPLPPLNGRTTGSDANSQAAEHEHASQLRLALPRNLQSPQYRHRYAQRHDVREGIASADDNVRRVYADAGRIWNAGIPSGANGSTLD